MRNKVKGQKKKYWAFENSAENANDATLYIYGDIVTYDLGDWNYPDDAVPNKFRKELAALGDVNTIHVRINSNGGSVFGAYGIMNLLKSHKAKIITYNDGIAASAATLVAMAGDSIVSALGSVWMIHLPTVSVQNGNALEFEKIISVLTAITDGMQDIYHAKTGIDRAEILKMMKNDTWLTAQQALEKGFVDSVTEMEVEAKLAEDGKTAFFNGIGVTLDDLRNKEAFVAMLPAEVELPKKINPAREVESAAKRIETGIGTAQQADITSKHFTDFTALQVKQQEQKNIEEALTMTLAELKAKHPETYEAAIIEGKALAANPEALTAARNEGVKAERERMKAIDDLDVPGSEAITNKAKYETFITAEQCAMEIIKAQKEKGASYLGSLQADAAGLDEVPAAPDTALAFTDEQAENALLAQTAESAKAITRSLTGQ